MKSRLKKLKKLFLKTSQATAKRQKAVRFRISTMLMAFVVLLLFSSSLYAASVTISWQPNTEPDLAGYRVYYDTNDSGDYQHVIDVGNHPYHTFTNLNDGETYRVSVTAYDLYNNESDFSPEISFTTPETTATELNMEIGEVTINHEWQRIDYDQEFDDPIVVASPLSRNSSDPAIVRIRNVDETGFEIRVQEWDYQNDDHGSESVSYLVMERGTFTLDDGTRLEAGSFNTDNATKEFDTFSFNQDFQVVPVIMASVATVHENDAVIGRINNVSQDSFQYHLQEQESNEKVHAEETVMYIAWEPSQGTIDGIAYEVGRPDNDIPSSGQAIYFDQDFSESPVLLANMQGVNGPNPANLRCLNKNTVQATLAVCEETSKDDELQHKAEPVGYLAFAAADNGSNSGDDGNNPESLKIEMGEVTINNEWQRIDYDQEFDDPIVVASPLSRNSSDPAIVRIRNVDETGFEIRVQEWDYQNDDHGSESVSYLVMERGTFTLDDGTRLEAGSFNTDNATKEFDTFSFNQDFQVVPVIMASVATVHENDAVIGRINNVSQDSFQYHLQEQESNEKVHAEETVMYIAWEPSQGTIDGIAYEVGRPDNDIPSSGQAIYFDQDFSESPVLLANMQGVNGPNPANLRCLNKNTVQATLAVCEETSKDDELQHKAEPVGYLAFATAHDDS